MTPLRRSGRLWRRLRDDQSGASTLEWSLLLAMIVIPMYWVFTVLLDVMVAHYNMTTFLNGWPFP